LLEAFDRRFSVDEVRRHKPATEVHAAVARAMQTEPANLCPGCMPHLGLFGCGRRGLGRGADFQAGKRAFGCWTSAADYRRGPQRSRRQPDLPLRKSRSRSAGITRLPGIWRG
jgi:hypothetical protein